METDEGTTARDIEEFVRDSTVVAASAESFQSCLQEIRAGRNTPADHLLSIVASIRSAARELDRMLLDLVLAAIARSEEPETRYDAMNVVTAAARDVPDPELKWKLEALATRLLIRSVRDARERTGFLVAQTS